MRIYLSQNDWKGWMIEIICHHSNTQFMNACLENKLIERLMERFVEIKTHIHTSGAGGEQEKNQSHESIETKYIITLFVHVYTHKNRY